VRTASRWRYLALPHPGQGAFQNRFVGGYLLYGAGGGWATPSTAVDSRLVAVRFDNGESVTLRVGHAVDRIEALGRNAIAVGANARDLHFTPIALGDRPALAGRYTRRGAAQGELRSHGFFYKAEGDDGGLLGLPVRAGGRAGYEHLLRESAAVLFLRNDALRLSELGELRSGREEAATDGCRASCVDWYGNARPLFLRGRVFALLGYELVEGQLSAGELSELRRVSFAPAPASVSR
jgi:hypothetical protein